MKNSISSIKMLVALAIVSIGSTHQASSDLDNLKKMKHEAHQALTIWGVAGAMAAGYKAGLSPCSILMIPYLGAWHVVHMNITGSATSDEFSHRWYKDLSRKYPKAHFDQRQLLSAEDLSNVFVAKDSSFVIDSFSLEEIGRMHDNKITQKPRSSHEVSDLAFAEWLMLREAGHVHFQDCSQRVYSSIGILMAIEGLYQGAKYASKPSLMRHKSIPVRGMFHVGLCASMAYLNYLIGNAYGKFTERKADDFANTLADEETLRLSIGCLQRIQELYGPVPADATFPSYQSRIDAIQQELDRRAQQKPL